MRSGFLFTKKASQFILVFSIEWSPHSCIVIPACRWVVHW
jgi:hypothetical protein